MNIIDTFFKFPIRIYEEADIRGASVLPSGNAIAPKIGVKRLRHTDIVGWQDMAYREVDETEEFPCCLVNTTTHDFLCHWPRKKFEDALEAFNVKYDKMIDEEIKKAMEREPPQEEDLVL